jgi:hypothetical protein
MLIPAAYFGSPGFKPGPGTRCTVGGLLFQLPFQANASVIFSNSFSQFIIHRTFRSCSLQPLQMECSVSAKARSVSIVG